jgi:hypothetical protein
MVLFNHKGESPSYIIAMTGVAIWFFISKKSAFEIFLLVFVFILTCLSPTDIFPRFIRDNYVNSYSLMALPCLLVWIKIIYEMIILKKDSPKSLANN